MDFSKFKTPDWLIVGGGVLFFIGGFLDWISVDVAGFGGASGGNVFDFFFTGIVPWILIIGSAVITVLLVTGTMKAGGPPWTLIIVAATVLGALLVLLRFIAPGLGEDLPDGLDLGRGIGLILCTIAAIVAAVGAVMNFTASGGTMRDLTDRNKLRSSFGQRDAATGDTPPPPPPPGATPPPPPPPVP
ncbi:MAG: hypothetical protein M3487_05975 [Actinomycetota bacterium]|nr:hypothetical protein [Actinomycetota bacterium]